MTTKTAMKGVRHATVGVLCSGAGSNLEAICAAAPALGYRVVVVVVNMEGAGALEVARRHGIPARLIRHTEYGSRAAFDAAVARALERAGAHYVALAGWMRIAGPGLLGAFPGRVVNIHPSLLPAFRGARAVRDALHAGVETTGCTVHLVTEELDAGPILAQASVAIEPGDDERTLHDRIRRAEHALYPRTLAEWIERQRTRSS